MLPTPRLLVCSRAITYVLIHRVDDIYLTLTKYGYFYAIGERVQTVTQICRQRHVGLLYVSLTRFWSSYPTYTLVIFIKLVTNH